MTTLAGANTNRTRGLIAVISTMVVVNLVYGLTLPLLSLVLDAQGISKTVIGMSIVAQACAGVVIAPFAPRLIVRFGGARSMQVATATAATVLILLGLVQNVYAWFPLRFVLGASAAILWSASEAVINELAEDNWRGRIMGIYGAAGSAGFALGPLILVFTGTQGLLPFLVTASFIVLAGLPLFWVQQSGSDELSEHPSLLKIFRIVPYIMLLNFTFAAALEAFLAFFPLYGIHIGIGEAVSLSLITVLGIGGLTLQIPLGWLADHVNRHKMLLACILLTMTGFLCMPWFITLPIAGPAVLFGIGGTESMMYTLGIVLLGQRFRGAELAAASVLFTGMWGAGTMIGPLFVGAGMDLLGNEAMPYLIVTLYACYLPFFLFRKST